MTGIASRGPVPKRTDDRIRTAPGSVETKKLFVDRLISREVEIPAADPDWHAVARLWYENACSSAQVVYYEPADWANLYLVAEAMSRELEDQVVAVIPATVHPETGKILEERKVVWGKVPVKGSSLNALKAMMTSLLITEGDRRRAGIEVVRTIQAEGVDDAKDAKVVDNVVEMETERQRLTGNA
jgi:hypothetical protein